MAIGPQRASGVMPNRSLFSSSPRGLPRAVGISFRRAFSGSLPVLFVRSLALLYLFCPFLLFFRRGEKMRAARRLVEGTDDVVSDVPPPGFGGGDARETVVRGRAVECEHRHRWVHISRGCCMPRCGGGGWQGEPQIELEILLYEKDPRNLSFSLSLFLSFSLCAWKKGG